MADLLRPSARRVPLRRRPRGRVLHVPRSWDPRRRHRGRGVDRQAAHRRTRDGTLRPGQRAGAARRRRVEGARGRRPPGGSAELDVRTPPVGAERRGTGDRGSCGRRLRNAHGRRWGPGGGGGPRRVVRMGRRLEAGRMESVAPHAVRTCAPSERRAARGVGGAGSGVPRPDPHGARARARRGRSSRSHRSSCSRSPSSDSPCATASASPAAASVVPRSTCGSRSLATSLSRPRRSLRGRSPLGIPHSRFRMPATPCPRCSSRAPWSRRRSPPGGPRRGWEGAGREVVALPARRCAARCRARHHRTSGRRRRRAPHRSPGPERHHRQARRARGAPRTYPGSAAMDRRDVCRMGNTGDLGPRLYRDHARYGGWGGSGALPARSLERKAARGLPLASP